MKKLFITICLALFLSSCGYGNLDYVKDNAENRWNSQGFEVVGYDGFQWDFWVGPYGGASVWYILKKTTDNGVIYSGALKRWGDEIHVYNVEAIDAIKP